MLLRASFALLVLLAASLAAPSVGNPGATTAAGLGRIEVYYGVDDLLVCQADAAIAVALAWTGVPDVPSGFYDSTSTCASFAYHIDVADDCTGGPGLAIRCEETGPPRWFKLRPDGWFWYERDNLGFHFEVYGWLDRDDAAP